MYPHMNVSEAELHVLCELINARTNMGLNNLSHENMQLKQILYTMLDDALYCYENENEIRDWTD